MISYPFSSPAYKILESYFTHPHKRICRDFLLCLKHLNIENYEACHLHIITSKRMDVTFNTAAKRQFKSSHIFEKKTRLFIR